LWGLRDLPGWRWDKRWLQVIQEMQRSWDRTARPRHDYQNWYKLAALVNCVLFSQTLNHFLADVERFGFAAPRWFTMAVTFPLTGLGRCSHALCRRHWWWQGHLPGLEGPIISTTPLLSVTVHTGLWPLVPHP
jgi:hypothetical protein